MAKSKLHTELPDGWEMKRISDFGNVLTGNTPPTNDESNYGNDFLFVSPFDLKENKYIVHTEKRLSSIGFNKSRKFKKGSVLFTCIGSTIGKSGIATCDLTSNQQINAIIVNDKNSNEYLYYQLENQAPKIKLLAGEQAVPIINKTQFEQVKILCPPLPEQRAIAAILSTWDTAIQTTQALIAQKEQEKKWLMQNLLTGKKRLKGFENTKWKKVGAGEVFESFTKKGFENEELLSATQDRGIIPRSMLEGRVTMPDGSTSGYKLVEPGDFIISLRSFQGGLEYSYYRGIVSPAYIVLKPKLKINDEFYKQYFKSYEFIGRLATAVIGIRDGKQISYDDFCIVKIPCPSIEEQTAIAQVLQTADKEIELLKAKLQQQKLQKKGLMQVLLTGKLRVASV
jgi:type I restriction enzyme S subunit